MVVEEGGSTDWCRVVEEGAVLIGVGECSVKEEGGQY